MGFNKDGSYIVHPILAILLEETLERELPLFDAIVTETSSVSTESRISGVPTMQKDKPEIDPNEIEDFYYSCGKVLKPDAYVVILAVYIMINIWVLTLHKAGLYVMPYPYAF